MYTTPKTLLLAGGRKAATPNAQGGKARICPWRVHMKRLFLIVCVVFSAALPAQAKDFDLIVARGSDFVELYIQAPAPNVPHLIGPYPDGMVQADGRIDIDPFRKGTADHGDAIFRTVTATVGGVPVTFEAMSMMVHPKDVALGFDDPIDGMTAISVCTVPERFTLYHLADLTTYLGYIAYPVAGAAPITLHLPSSATVQVRDYTDGTLRRSGLVATDGAGRLVLDGPPPVGVLAWLRGVGKQ